MISGKIKLPGDKSISHRAALFAGFKEGISTFTNFSLNDDCRATLQCLEKLGVEHKQDGDHLTIFGKPIIKWQQPSSPLDAHNSGTTARLISGLLAALPFNTTLVGDASLSKRPMRRVINPLKEMGAQISSNDGRLPLTFKGNAHLKAINYLMPVASAQVKSALLLTGLHAEGNTKIIEEATTRDHTERMLNLPVQIVNGKKEISTHSSLTIPNLSMEIPGDFSSAAFFICATLGIPGSSLEISSVSLNPTRIGLIDIIKIMGAEIEYTVRQNNPEPIGEIQVRFSHLKNITVPKEVVPNIIDEIPVLAILATQAEGTFVLKNAEELRFKESDRIATIVKNLANLGIEVDEYRDGFSISGPQKIKGGKIITHGDHRIAMAFSIATLFTNEKIEIDNPDCASVSFPDFYHILNEIQE